MHRGDKYCQRLGIELVEFDEFQCRSWDDKGPGKMRLDDINEVISFTDDMFSPRIRLYHGSHGFFVGRTPYNECRNVTK